MTHLTELQCAMFVDEAMTLSEADSVRLHLSECDSCSALIASLGSERTAIRSALGIDEVAVEIPAVETLNLSRPMTLKDLAIANILTGLVFWLGQFLWKTLFGELIVGAASRITSFYVPDVFELFVNAGLYLTQEGTIMINTYLGLIVSSFFAVTLAWLVLYFRRLRSVAGLCLAVTLSVALLTPPEANAIEIMRDERAVNVPVGETIDDTLIVATDTAIIDGDVKGDLVAFGRRIVVKGNVGGNLVSFAETVSVEGSVGGSVISAGSSVDIDEAIIGGDVWVAGENITLRENSKIDGNATIATKFTSVAASVGRDLTVFAETVEVTGQVGEDLEAFAATVNLLGNASVTGDVRLRVEDEDDFSRSANATVGGSVEFLSVPEEFEPRNRFLSPGYYVGALFQLVSAFIVGAFILWLIPVLRDETLEGGIEGLKTAGIGLIAIICTPVILILCAVTVVGIPLALLGLFTFIVTVYLTKILLASILGQMLLDGTDYEDSLLLPLLLGLVIIVVATHIPVLGGVVGFLVTIVGFGMIVRLVLDYTTRRVEDA